MLNATIPAAERIHADIIYPATDKHAPPALGPRDEKHPQPVRPR
jgi:hypothetical protein